jgi:KDO2-lipid IV(A) lauroyltransferase
MPVDLQRLDDSRFVLSLVSALGWAFPPRPGHALADLVAARIARRQDSRMIQAVRANQWIVRGETLGKEALDRAVIETLRSSARSIFDLYHYMRNPKATGRLIVLDPASQEVIRRPEFDKRGLMIVGLHLSSFDLVLQWFIQQGMKALILTIPNPQGGRRKEYEARKKAGVNLVPASFSALRQALRHLQQGGVVLTGIDRPIPAPKVRPRFFGRPAALPVHHISLAVKARVPVMIMAPSLQPDGKYHVLTSGLIEMDPYPDRAAEELQNAERVLGIAEGFIRQAPQQWSISLPVWPETLDLALNKTAMQ